MQTRVFAAKIGESTLVMTKTGRLAKFGGSVLKMADVELWANLGRWLNQRPSCHSRGKGKEAWNGKRAVGWGECNVSRWIAPIHDPTVVLSFGSEEERWLKWQDNRWFEVLNLYVGYTLYFMGYMFIWWAHILTKRQKGDEPSLLTFYKGLYNIHRVYFLFFDFLLYYIFFVLYFMF